MKKYLSLILKDFILLKNYLLFTVVIIIGMPLLFLPVVSSVETGVAGFTISYMFALYTTAQSLAYYEAKFGKAESILNSAPYSKHAIVISRYLFLLIIYVITLLVYLIMSFIIPQLKIISFAEAALALLIGSLLIGILQPLTYKFGIGKMRYINVIVMIGAGITFPYLVKAISGGNINFDFFKNISPILLGVLALLITAIILVVSVIVSIKVYNKKEF